MLADAAINVLPARMPAAAARRKLRLVSVDGEDPEARPGQAIRDGAFGDLDNARRMALVEFIAAGAPAMIAEAEEGERSALTDSGETPRRAGAGNRSGGRAAAGSGRGSDGRTRTDGEDERARERLTAVFRDERGLRAALLEHVLLAPQPNGIRMACRELEATGLGLEPDADDLAGLVKAARPRAEGGMIDPEIWEDFSGSRNQPARAQTRSAMQPSQQWIRSVKRRPLRIPSGGGDAGTAKPAPGRHGNRTAASTARRCPGKPTRLTPATFAFWRCPLLSISAGPTHSTERRTVTPRSRPEERLRAVLGDELSERVLQGFVAVLGRSDLPQAAAIAQIHCADGEHEAEAPLICGIAVALGRGLPLDAVERATLEAALMAWRRMPRGVTDGNRDIGFALEDMVFKSVADIERHYRASIEPQLACNAEFVRELDLLADEYRLGFDGVAGRLSIEWLRAWPAMDGQAQADLLTCAVEKAPRGALRELAVDCRDRAHPDEFTRLNWLSVACIVDLEGSRGALLATAENDRGFLGHVRERIADQKRFADTPLESLVFVVEAFGTRWPRMADRPGSGRAGRGWNDPRDASAFIERTIHAIANRPEPEAGDALRHLVANHAPTYADTARQALAFQRKVWRDCGHEVPTVNDLPNASICQGTACQEMA